MLHGACESRVHSSTLNWDERSVVLPDYGSHAHARKALNYHGRDTHDRVDLDVQHSDDHYLSCHANSHCLDVDLDHGFHSSQSVDRMELDSTGSAHDNLDHRFGQVYLDLDCHLGQIYLDLD